MRVYVKRMALTDVAADFVTNMTGILDTTLLAAIEDSILEKQSTYDSTGVIASNLYTLSWQIMCADVVFLGMHVAKAKLLSGGVTGTVYTADFPALIADTNLFCILNMSTYTAILFFDNAFVYKGTWLTSTVTGLTLPSIMSGGKWMAYP
jgi:hypothetical protein